MATSTCGEHDEEESIVWVEDASQHPYVRESIRHVVGFPGRRPPARRGNERLIGYATLERPSERPEVYRQRVFYLRDYDPYEDFPNHAPCEAVDPRQVEPNRCLGCADIGPEQYAPVERAALRRARGLKSARENPAMSEQ
jgi:Family of unknown function (DUF6009)